MLLRSRNCLGQEEGLLLRSGKHVTGGRDRETAKRAKTNKKRRTAKRRKQKQLFVSPSTSVRLRPRAREGGLLLRSGKHLVKRELCSSKQQKRNTRPKTNDTPAAAASVQNTHVVTPDRVENSPSYEHSSDALGTEVLRLRLNRTGARSGAALQASLVWNDIADLDLACTTPDGTTINYMRKEAQCGGWLDVDMNVNAHSASEEAIENIFWASAPSGKYSFKVTNFRCHTNEKFPNAERSVPFRLFLTKNGKQTQYNGTLKNKESVVCSEFELAGDGALGSFVVMPPSDSKTTFKEACEKNMVTYSQGNGYYAVARMENIQDYKVLLLQDTTKDTFLIGATACRSFLGWGPENVRKGPKDIPAGYRLFVQSTSHNRKIPPGTHTLMKVSVAEALKHRPAHDTTFAHEKHTIGQS